MDLLNLREPVSAWSHGAWLLLALPVGLSLWRRGAGDRSKQVSMLVFTVSLAVCALGSVAYHAVWISDRWIARLLLVDHIGIVVLIAGTYTPIAWNLMRGRWRTGTLAAAWLVAALIATLQVAFNLPPWLHTSLYLGMGWGAVICFVELARILPYRDLRLIVAGGLFYSVGAVCNLTGWPALWPGIVGTHDLFHVFVIAGSLCHYAFICQIVAPAVRAPFARTAGISWRRHNPDHVWAGPRRARAT